MKQAIEPIESLIQKLIGEDDPKTSSYFQLILAYDSEESVDEVRSHLMQRGDLQSIHLLMNYLLKIRTKYAYQILTDLAEDENSVIRNEAMDVIEHISADEQPRILLNLIGSVHEDTRIFAVQQLGNLRNRASVIPLIDRLRESENKGDQIIILKSLAQIEDDRCVKPIENLFSKFESEPELLEEALSTLGYFSESIDSRFIRKCLSSQDMTVRGSTYLAILKLKGKRWESFIAQGLFSETDSKMKMNILSSIRTIRIKSLFMAVFTSAALDKDEGVRMMAQTVLKRIQSEKIIRWLLALERSNTGKLKEQVLRMLTVYSYEPRVTRVLKKNVMQEYDIHLKLVAIEYLGYSNSGDLKQYLIDLTTSGEKYSYVASVSLSHLIRSDDQDVLFKMISLTRKTSAPIVQLYLRFIMRIENAELIKQEIRLKVLLLAGAADQNIRYLALRCLSKWDTAENLAMLFDNACYSHSRMIRSASARGMSEMILNSLDRVSEFCRLAGRNAASCRVAFSVLRKMDFHRVYYREMIEGMVHVLLDSESVSIKKRLSVVLRRLILDHQALFLDAFCRLDWQQDELMELIRITKMTSVELWHGLHGSEFSRHYQKSTDKVKKEFLSLFSMFNSVDEDLKELVFSEADNDTVITMYARATIHEWLKAGAKGLIHG